MGRAPNEFDWILTSASNVATFPPSPRALDASGFRTADPQDLQRIIDAPGWRAVQASFYHLQLGAGSLARSSGAVRVFGAVHVHAERCVSRMVGGAMRSSLPRL